MNYYALTKKYFPSAKVVVEDRTYDGLVWKGPGDKPLESIFKSLQDEEDRLARVAGQAVLSRDGLMQEKQRQARAQAEADLVPFQKTLGDYFEAERLKALKLKQDALDLKMRLSLKEHVIDCWREISGAQEALNKKAQAYLEETKHYLAWDEHKVPAEVLAEREKAHALLSDGQLVYADWANLRAAEMPSREEIQEAIKIGGQHLARMKQQCKDIALKYPKPRKTGH